jgi:hypothetical protein
MSKLSYDDGVVRSSVVLYDGLWIEIRCGDLTGKALKAAGRRRWGGKDVWIAAVCQGVESRDGTTSATPAAGVERQEWAVLGSYENRFYKIHDETYHGTAPGDGYKERTARAKEELLREIRFLQGRYNESRGLRARLYWAEMLQNVAQTGYCGSRWHEKQCTMWILDWPELARQICALTRAGRRTAKEAGVSEWRMGGFWFDVLYGSCMGKDFVHQAPGPLPERLDLFVAI